MFLSHYRAGTGAVLVETREEGRLLADLLAELPQAEVRTVAAPTGPVRNARTGAAEKGGSGLANGYAWAMDGPGRVLVVHDWHVLANNPGQWRGLLDALPGLRSPKGAGQADYGSLVVFVGPAWELRPENPLRGLIPTLPYAPPGREALRAVAERLHPLNGDAEAVIDALCGLSADTAEQAAAEVLTRCGGRYDVDALRGARKQALQEAGLELWAPQAELGGLQGFQDFATQELLPWVRDEKLSVRRVLMAGVPGVGKSYSAAWLAHQLRCECARLSIPALKAGIVGASESNLRRALSVLDAMAQHAPLVCVLDEIDTIARDGLDGGTSSGMFAELLTWLNESTSQCVVIATLNRLDKLDAALASRFQGQFFVDLPNAAERQSVCRIHYARLGCDPACLDLAAESTAQATEGCSSRELAKDLCPTVLRLTNRKPDADTIVRVCREHTPTATTLAEQLTAMRRAASSLRRANNPTESNRPQGRRIGGAQ